MAANCPSQRPGGRSQVCYNCQQPGHRANECTNDRVERPPMKCYNCGQEGHASRDCPEERVGGSYGGDKKCYVSFAALIVRVKRQRLTTLRTCVPLQNCGEVGHISRECPSTGEAQA